LKPFTGSGRLVAYLVLALLALVAMVPFYTSMVAATAGPGGALGFVPDRFLISNLMNVAFHMPEEVPVARAYGNSLFIASTTTVLTGYVGLFTAYGFALFSFRGKKILWALVLALMMVPQTISLLGFYKLVVAMNLTDTYWPLILPGMGNAYVVFYLRQYLMTMVPLSLLEAARIDGAGEMAIFHRLVLPNVLPGMVPVLIIVFLQSWNAFMIPLLILNDHTLKTLPIVYSIIGNFGLSGLTAAVSMLTMVVLVGMLLRFVRHAHVREGING